MAAGDWEFVWVDPGGERFPLLCTDERKVSFKVDQPGTSEFVIPLRTDLGRYIATGSGWGYVLIYYKGTLRAVHETVSTDVGPATSEGVPSVGIACTESAFAKAAGGIISASPFTIPSTTMNIGEALGDLALANTSWGIGEAPFNGLNVGSVQPSAFEQGTDFLTLIQAFAFRASGFHFTFAAPSTFTLNGANTVVGNLNTWNLSGDPTLYNHRWEYGTDTRANLAGYSWKRLGGEHLANVVYVPSNGDSEGNAAGVKTATDFTSVATYGSRRRWVTADFPDATLRQNLADDHVFYRKAPRRVLSITPAVNDGTGRVPEIFADYLPGAVMPVKIVDDGVTLVSGNVMVYGINVTLDKDGKEMIELETSQDT